MHDLFTYPFAPGYKEKTTSKAAADSMADALNPLQRAVVNAISQSPKTADEVALTIGETVLATRPRLSELRELNKIVDSGLRRKNTSGRNAIVWTMADK